MTYAVFAEGLSGIGDLGDLKESVRVAALQAINKAAERGRKMAADEIGREVAFPAQYLQPGAGRLTVSKKATRGDLSAAIRARGRATSLSRFVTGTAARGAGVTVQVTPGKSLQLKKAFLIKLRAGSGSVDNRFNKGLAVRLRPGESLRNKTQAIRMERNLYLLYGPSVDQVFINNSGKGVAEDISDDILRIMDNEFHRLLER